MYFYIYDSYLNNKKYESVLNKIEARLLDLGINGRHAKMTVLKNMKESIEDGLQKGAETIVAIGNDQTLFDVIRITAGFPVTIGYIPVATKSRLAQILDIPENERACDVLSARLCEKIDIGKINNHYFLSSIELENGSVTIQCDGRYWVTPLSPNNFIQICNFGYFSSDKSACLKSNPQDGILEAIIRKSRDNKGLLFWSKKHSEESVFPVRRLKIISQTEAIAVLADGQRLAKTPVTIEVVPRKLKIIVGKKRMF